LDRAPTFSRASSKLVRGLAIPSSDRNAPGGQIFFSPGAARGGGQFRAGPALVSADQKCAMRRASGPSWTRKEQAERLIGGRNRGTREKLGRLPSGWEGRLEPNGVAPGPRPLRSRRSARPVPGGSNHRPTEAVASRIDLDFSSAIGFGPGSRGSIPYDFWGVGKPGKPSAGRGGRFVEG